MKIKNRSVILVLASMLLLISSNSFAATKEFKSSIWTKSVGLINLAIKIDELPYPILGDFKTQQLNDEDCGATSVFPKVAVLNLTSTIESKVISEKQLELKALIGKMYPFDNITKLCKQISLIEDNQVALLLDDSGSQMADSFKFALSFVKNGQSFSMIIALNPLNSIFPVVVSEQELGGTYLHKIHYDGLWKNGKSIQYFLTSEDQSKTPIFEQGEASILIQD